MHLALRGLLTALMLPCGALAQTGTAGPTDLLPQGAYGAELHRALSTGEIDFAALRAAYAADPAYYGRSRLADRNAEALVAGQAGSAVPDWSGDNVLRSILADFPLLDTQLAAFSHFKTSGAPNADRMMASHARFYQGLMTAILATRRDGPEGPVFTVLSVGEEHAVLSALKRRATGQQALLQIDGVPHDRLETDQGPVFFDISAFFGR